MFKKLLALSAGLLITFAAYAATAQLRADAPQTYVVKKGDTLWGIAARYLHKPWLWPEIWDVNQQVRNPHRIYPGDVLNLDVNGLHIARHSGAEENPIPTVPLSAIQPFLKDLRIVAPDQLKDSPYIVAVQSNEPRATEGMNLYVRDLPSAQAGERFAVVRPTHIYRQSKFQSPVPVQVSHLLSDNVDMVQSPWDEDSRGDNEWGNPRDVIGLEVRVIGTAKLLRTGDPATLLLTNASLEVRAGDRLLPIDDTPYDYTFYPHPPRSVPADARVLALSNGYDGISVQGPMDVVALNVGSANGVDNGTTYAIYEPGDTVPDLVKGNTHWREFSPKVKLPGEYVGHLMVFRTYEHVSYALVMDGIRPVRQGDTLKAPM